MKIDKQSNDDEVEKKKEEFSVAGIRFAPASKSKSGKTTCDEYD